MRETQHQVAIAVGAIHADLERAAGVARAAYDVALDRLRPGSTFGEVVAGMEQTLKDGGGWIVHPIIHGLNPWAAASGFGTGLKAYTADLGYDRLEHIPRPALTCRSRSSHASTAPVACADRSTRRSSSLVPAPDASGLAGLDRIAKAVVANRAPGADSLCLSHLQQRGARRSDGKEQIRIYPTAGAVRRQPVCDRPESPGYEQHRTPSSGDGTSDAKRAAGRPNLSR